MILSMTGWSNNFIKISVWHIGTGRMAAIPVSVCAETRTRAHRLYLSLLSSSVVTVLKFSVFTSLPKPFRTIGCCSYLIFNHFH